MSTAHSHDAEPQTLEERERQLRAEYRADWERLRMAEEFRVRPAQTAHGRPASLWLLLFWGAILAGVTIFLGAQVTGALGEAGPGPDNLFSSIPAGLMMVLAWLAIILTTRGVYLKYSRLREASARHHQGLEIALGDLRRRYANDQGDRAR